MKTSERFALRGKLDSLNAQIVFLQTLSDNEEFISDLEEVRGIIRTLQRCEASGSPFEGEFVLWGKTAEELHGLSHNPDGGHVLPHVDMGREASSINLLRTMVREAELASCRVFPDDELRVSHMLNRMSSALYVLMFKYLPEGYSHRLTFAKT